MSSHGQSNEVFIPDHCLATQFSVSSFERVCQSFNLSHNKDEIIQVQASGFGIMLTQNILQRYSKLKKCFK